MTVWNGVVVTPSDRAYEKIDDKKDEETGVYLQKLILRLEST